MSHAIGEVGDDHAPGNMNASRGVDADCDSPVEVWLLSYFVFFFLNTCMHGCNVASELLVCGVCTRRI